MRLKGGLPKWWFPHMVGHPTIYGGQVWELPHVSVGCPWDIPPVFGGTSRPPQAGPNSFGGHPTGPFCSQDPRYPSSTKAVILGPFLLRLAFSLVIHGAPGPGFSPPYKPSCSKHLFCASNHSFAASKSTFHSSIGTNWPYVW